MLNENNNFDQKLIIFDQKDNRIERGFFKKTFLGKMENHFRRGN